MNPGSVVGDRVTDLFLRLAGAGMVLTVAFVVSVALAEACEPTSLWLWRDVLGVTRPGFEECVCR